MEEIPPQFQSTGFSLVLKKKKKLPVPPFSVYIFVIYQRTSEKARKLDLKKSLLETDATQALFFWVDQSALLTKTREKSKIHNSYTSNCSKDM